MIRTVLYALVLTVAAGVNAKAQETCMATASGGEVCFESITNSTGTAAAAAAGGTVNCSADGSATCTATGSAAASSAATATTK